MEGKVRDRKRKTYDEALGVKLACADAGIEVVETDVGAAIVSTWTIEALLNDAGLDWWSADDIGSCQSGEEGGDDGDGLHFEEESD